MSLGERIKQLREKNNIQQIDMAHILGFNNNSTISNYETNKSKPNIDRFIEICKLLETDANYLYTR